MSAPDNAPPDASNPCPACGGTAWLALPVLPAPAMRSDGALLDLPLAKATCAGCGLVRHATLPPEDVVARTFREGYALYTHAPGGAFERARQSGYARWIVGHIGDRTPARVFEVGCGNGSLLLELAEAWPSACFHGIDPSPGAIAHAREAGVDAKVGYLDGSYDGGRYDLVVSVNVIEHTRDPRAFLDAAGRLVAPSGRLLVICPDGDRPSSELLVHDHLFTFPGASLARMAGASGLRVVDRQPAPAELGEFQSLLIELGEPALAQAAGVRALHDVRVDYLRAWAELDARLAARCDRSAPLWCFGAGEATRMLHAYAAGTTRTIAGYVVDGPAADVFAGRPLRDYGAAFREVDRLVRPQVLLGVRPQVQPQLARRLQDDGVRVIRWDDLVPAL